MTLVSFVCMINTVRRMTTVIIRYCHFYMLLLSKSNSFYKQQKAKADHSGCYFHSIYFAAIFDFLFHFVPISVRHAD